MNPVRQLSPEAKAKIKSLSGARPAAFLSAAATTWLTIAAAIAAALYFDTIVTTIFAIYIVATRQNLLALMIHEQTHYLGLKSRHGDRIANLLVAYPLIAPSIEGYAKIHLRHHRHYFTPQDPDFLRKNGPEWTFPMGRAKLAKLFLRDLTGMSFLRLTAREVQTGRDDAFRRRNPSPAWLRPLFFLIVGLVLTLVGGWTAFLLYWVLPLVTILPAIIRWGAICEHVYGREGVSVEESSPVILPTPLSRILLPNMNFALHPYHHFFPGVSFGNLPKLHAIFEAEGLTYPDMVFNGPLDYLRFLLTGRRSSAPVRGQDRIGAPALADEAHAL